MPFHHASLLTTAPDSTDHAVIHQTLETVRDSLGMEVAYLSEFVGDRAVFRAVSAPGLEAMIRPSQSMDIREVYCKHIIDGKLPRLMADTSAHSIAVDLPITQMIPIASHVSVPVCREDGSVFGMFCFLSRTARPDLTDQHLAFVEAQAQAVASRIFATKVDNL